MENPKNDWKEKEKKKQKEKKIYKILPEKKDPKNPPTV